MIVDGVTEGLLASAVTLETGVGGPACPWIIRVLPHQRINITLLDFSVMAASPREVAPPAARRGQQYRASTAAGRGGGAGGWDGPMSIPSWLGAPCDEYAVVTEAGAGSGDGGRGRSTAAGRNSTVCGRRRRQAPVYLSDTNVVQVRVDVAASRSHRFILKYQGLPVQLQQRFSRVFFYRSHSRTTFPYRLGLIDSATVFEFHAFNIELRCNVHHNREL